MSLSDVFIAGGTFKKGDVLATLEQDDYHRILSLQS